MNTPSNDDVIRHTKKWVNDVVVGFNFCPFAKFEVDKDSIRYSVFEGGEEAQALEFLLEECDLLDSNENVETSLLLFPRHFASFDDYLNLVDMANALLEERGYEGVYQLATFHPEYCFFGEEPSDNSNYTNRSPYPTLHLLREESLEQALDRFPQIGSIPGRNIELTREMDAVFLKGLLQACYKDS